MSMTPLWRQAFLVLTLIWVSSALAGDIPTKRS